MKAGWQVLCAGLVGSAVMLAGCSVRVNKKTAAGEDKDVQISTPLGGLQVHKDQAGAADVGLPRYPGAVPASSDAGTGSEDGSKSVDVQLGFGPFKLRVQVASYVSTDPQPKVQEFYQKALARYGDVLQCRGDETIGQPTRTAEGLTCKEEYGNQQMRSFTDSHELRLKAGSSRRQHIVIFKPGEPGGTHFSLIAVALPAGQGANKDRATEE